MHRALPDSKQEMNSFKAEAGTLIIQIQWSKLLSPLSKGRDILEWCFVTFDRKYLVLMKRKSDWEKYNRGGNKVRKGKWPHTKMLFIEKYNLKSSWCLRKIKAVKCCIVKELQSYLNVTLIFLTSVSSKFQKINVIHNLSAHDLSINRENRAQWYFSYKRNLILRIFIFYFA